MAIESSLLPKKIMGSQILPIFYFALKLVIEIVTLPFVDLL